MNEKQYFFFILPDINYPLLILSFDFPLTLLWVGFAFPKIVMGELIGE